MTMIDDRTRLGLAFSYAFKGIGELQNRNPMIMGGYTQGLLA
jgi:hypothetical protein